MRFGNGFVIPLRSFTVTIDFPDKSIGDGQTSPSKEIRRKLHCKIEIGLKNGCANYPGFLISLGSLVSRDRCRFAWFKFRDNLRRLDCTGNEISALNGYELYVATRLYRENRQDAVVRDLKWKIYENRRREFRGVWLDRNPSFEQEVCSDNCQQAESSRNYSR